MQASSLEAAGGVRPTLDSHATALAALAASTLWTGGDGDPAPHTAAIRAALRERRRQLVDLDAAVATTSSPSVVDQVRADTAAARTERQAMVRSASERGARQQLTETRAAFQSALARARSEGEAAQGTDEGTAPSRMQDVKRVSESIAAAPQPDEAMAPATSAWRIGASPSLGGRAADLVKAPVEAVEASPGSKPPANGPPGKATASPPDGLQILPEPYAAVGANRSAASGGVAGATPSVAAPSGPSGTEGGVSAGAKGVAHAAAPSADAERTPALRTGQRPNVVDQEGETSHSELRIEQLLRVLKARIGRRDSSTTIRLDPPELGRLQVDLRLRDSVLQVRIEAESRMAHDLLRQDMDALRDGLKLAGLDVDRIELRLHETTRSPDADGSADFRDSREEQAQQRRAPDGSGGSAAALQGEADQAVRLEDRAAELGRRPAVGWATVDIIA